MAKIKIASYRVDIYPLSVDALVEDIRNGEDELKQQGATEIRVDHENRESWDDRTYVYLDGYREETDAEIKTRKADEKRQNQLYIANLERQINKMKAEL